LTCVGLKNHIYSKKKRTKRHTFKLGAPESTGGEREGVIDSGGGEKFFGFDKANLCFKKDKKKSGKKKKRG